MKKIINKRLLISAALLLILAQLFSLTAFAAQNTVNWEISDDEMKLSDGVTKYTYYRPSLNIYPVASTVYIFSDNVEMSYETEHFGTACGIAKGMDNDEIVWLTGSGGNYFYVTDKGKMQLNSFLNGDVGSYRLEESAYYSAKIPTDLIKELELSENIVTVDVRDLNGLDIYTVTANDRTNTVAYVHGAIYLTNDGHYYYLNYTELDNSHFDANGNFSYRSGQVDVTELDADQLWELMGVEDNIKYVPREHVFENRVDDDYSVTVHEGGMIIFWLFFFLFGFILPIPCLVIGLLMARSKKRGYPRYWYITAAIAALWLFISAVILVLLLI